MSKFASVDVFNFHLWQIQKLGLTEFRDAASYASKDIGTDQDPSMPYMLTIPNNGSHIYTSIFFWCYDWRRQ